MREKLRRVKVLKYHNWDTRENETLFEGWFHRWGQFSEGCEEFDIQGIIERDDGKVINIIASKIAFVTPYDPNQNN